LKPERWGSLLVQENNQEEKACDKRRIIIIIIIIGIRNRRQSFIVKHREILEDSAGRGAKKLNFTVNNEEPCAKIYSCNDFFVLNQSSCELPKDFEET
jgi:hypothetical protein